jgi:serine/threonine protein kinase
MSQPPKLANVSPASLGSGDVRQDTILLSDSSDSVAPVASPAGPPAAPLHNSPRLAPLTQRYDILAEAGCGNMGDVYKARDRETGEIVALKLVKPEIASDAAMMERFKNELLFARKITHKNVCRVYDFNRIAGTAYTSMEFVEGESLRSVLNRFGGFPIRKGIAVALQICSGLKEAHAQGIVHRDLKPENVMIDAQGNVKIMDFGIARSMEAATRLTSSMVGTPAYMAPEQVSGKAVDYRTDIYALGLILYEMFTGMQAVQADTPVAVALKQLRETPQRPHDVDPTIPLPIERAILKCVEKDPAKRFQSVAELEKVLAAPGITGTSTNLAPFVTGEPTPVVVTAHRTAPFLPAAHKPRRVPLIIWVTLGAALVFSGLAGAHWAQVVNTAKLTPPPPALPLPKPPEFALTISAPETDSSSTATPAPAPAKAKTPANPSKAKAPETSTRTESRPAAEARNPMAPAPRPNASAKASNTDVVTRSALPGKKPARQNDLETVPNDVEQRANKAFGEGKPSAKGRMEYLWVGRYQKEDNAKDVVKKLRGLSLPAYSFPHYGPGGGQFWVVITGPFGADRASDVMQWLEAQGYKGVRPLDSSSNRPVPPKQPQGPATE